MNLEERITAFSTLGKKIKTLPDSERKELFDKAGNENAWFTPESLSLAFEGVLKFLDEGALRQWTTSYSFPKTPKTIGVAMAGNIPLVGFHDYLSILIAGHIIQIKLSSQDAILLPFLNKLLLEIEPRFSKLIFFEERLSGYDAAIATGSDNTARYFSYYFKNVPHIIRKNRSSCGVIMGEEAQEELKELGKDVFSYFGLGCRNVSKLYIPEDYDLIPILKSWERYEIVAQHHKYANNYDYQRSIHLINQKHFYDNGVVLLMEDDRLVSPISVVFYEKYKDQNDLKSRLAKNGEKLQCLVSANAWYPGSIAFGKAQTPALWDYADNIDTLKFLESL